MPHCPSNSRPLCRSALLGSVLLLASLALPSRAELVILDDGSFLKVKAFDLQGEQASLTFRGGGRMLLPMTRVDRVIDDEVLEPDPLPAVAVPAPVRPLLALRFESSQAVPEGPWGGLIWEASKRHALNPKLVEAVIRAESEGNPRAMSRVGARGLMQLMPATAERFGVPFHRLFDPAQNLEAGTRYLSWLIDQFPDDLAKVLAAYNAGEQAVARYGGIPPYRETRAYVRRIFATLGVAAGGGTSPSPAPATTVASARAADASR
jgi:soluble lytic murein transglycosylase-like protein